MDNRNKLYIYISIVLLVATSLIMSLVVIVDNSFRRDISNGYISETSIRAVEEYQNFFMPIANVLNITKKWGETGQLELNNPESLAKKLIPIYKQLEFISAIILADSSGNEFYLSVEQNKWLIRTLAKQNKRSVFVNHTWSPENYLINIGEIETDYDPRNRPWFKGALSRETGDSVYWSEIYLFNQQAQPGITGSLAFESDESELIVIAIDLLYRDIIRLISNIKMTPNGITFLFNNTGALIGQPDSLELSDIADLNKVFTPFKEVDDPIINAFLNQWDEEQFAIEDPMKIDTNGQIWWGDFRSLGKRNSEIMVGCLIPESDFLGEVNDRRNIVYLLITIILLVSGFSLYKVFYIYSGNPEKQFIGIDNDDALDEVNSLIAKGESKQIEFKSTMRMNLKSGKFGKEIEYAWLKTIAAFMNSQGGTLLIGVQDNGEIYGLEADQFENEDRCRLHFKNLFNQHIGSEFSQYIYLHLHHFKDLQVVSITCKKSKEPVFVQSSNKEEEFYIRSGPSSSKLVISKALKYIKQNFPAL